MLHLSTVTKLKLIYLFLGMMFWYGIEQLFMDTFLHDPNLRAWSTALFVGTMLIFDIPGGVIADRFGRRKTIIMGAFLQFAGILLMGISSSVIVFLTGIFIYAVYWALCNGAVQAMMYDHLAAIEKHQEYAQHQGSVYAYGYVGAGIANLLSGVIGHYFGLRMPYLVSLIPTALALLLAYSLNETVAKEKSDKSSVAVSLYPRQVFDTLRRSPIAGVFAAQIILGLFVFMTICEFGQILLLSYGIEVVQLGILWAVVAGLVAFGLHHAHRFQKWPWQTVLAYVAALGLFATFQGPIAILLFMLVYMGTEIIHNIAETELQHATKSSVRATVLSSVNFVGNLLALLVIWCFNRILQVSGIHNANRLAAITIAVCLVVIAMVVYRHQRHARRQG